MVLSGWHIGKSSERLNCCRVSVRVDELVDEAMFIFKWCPSCKQNALIILVLASKMCLIMSVQALYQFIMNTSGSASIACSLLLILRGKINILFYISCFYFYLTTLQHCGIRGILYLGYSSLTIHNFSVSCTAGPGWFLTLSHNFLQQEETAGVCKGKELNSRCFLKSVTKQSRRVSKCLLNLCYLDLQVAGEN